MRTCYRHVRTDYRAAILGLSIYRSRRKVTNIDSPRWALRRLVAPLVQGSPSISFLCGGCQYYCHPNDNRISGWVYSNAVLNSRCGGCKWNILYQLSFSECYSLMLGNASNVTRLLSRECSGTMHGKAMQRDEPEVNGCRWILQTRSELPF